MKFINRKGENGNLNATGSNGYVSGNCEYPSGPSSHNGPTNCYGSTGYSGTPSGYNTATSTHNGYVYTGHSNDLNSKAGRKVNKNVIAAAICGVLLVGVSVAVTLMIVDSKKNTGFNKIDSENEEYNYNIVDSRTDVTEDVFTPTDNRLPQAEKAEVDEWSESNNNEEFDGNVENNNKNDFYENDTGNEEGDTDDLMDDISDESPVAATTPDKTVEAEETYTKGILTTTSYTNSYFDVQFTLPDQWEMHTEEEIEDLFGEYSELSGGWEMTASNALSFCMVYLGVEKNPAYTYLSLEDYISKQVSILSVDADSVLSFDKKRTIGGYEYSLIEACTQIDGVDVNCDFYIRKKEDVFLVIGAMYLPDNIANVDRALEAFRS